MKEIETMTAKLDVNGTAIKELAEILNETGLSEIEYEDQGCRIRVAKNLSLASASFAPAAVHQAPIVHAPAVAHAKDSATKSLPSGHVVRSPMVGTAYLSAEPGAAPFVKVGDRVNAGQTLLIIEAMKVMNPIKSTHTGVVKEIMTGDATPVEFDEPLMVIE